MESCKGLRRTTELKCFLVLCGIMGLDVKFLYVLYMYMLEEIFLICIKGGPRSIAQWLIGVKGINREMEKISNWFGKSHQTWL